MWIQHCPKLSVCLRYMSHFLKAKLYSYQVLCCFLSQNIFIAYKELIDTNHVFLQITQWWSNAYKKNDLLVSEKSDIQDKYENTNGVRYKIQYAVSFSLRAKDYQSTLSAWMLKIYKERKCAYDPLQIMLFRRAKIQIDMWSQLYFNGRSKNVKC